MHLTCVLPSTQYASTNAALRVTATPYTHLVQNNASSNALTEVVVTRVERLVLRVSDPIASQVSTDIVGEEPCTCQCEHRRCILPCFMVS